MGGVTTHIIDLCRELLSHGINVSLVYGSEDCGYKNQISKLEINSGFKQYPIDMRGVRSDWRRFLAVVNKMTAIAKNDRIDLIHSHSQSLCVVSAVIKLRTGIPYIWTNHIDAIDSPALFKKILRVLRFPVISVSSDLKSLLVNDFGVSEERITIVNNGINIEHYAPLTESEMATLKKKHDCTDKYIIGLLARMTPVKGHMYLLEAVDRLQQKYAIKDIKILIAGKLYEPAYLEQLKNYAKGHDINMQFLGFQNPRDIFGICNVSVLPSIYEGFPLTVLESLAMGCPAIRSDTPGWADTKDIALVFKKQDVNALTEHLDYAYHNRESMCKMGCSGRKTVMEKFTIQNQVDQTMKVYEKYVKGR